MTFCKTQAQKKKPFCCNPPLDQKILFVEVFCFETKNLYVLKPKTFMLNRKHYLKSGNTKDKKKGLERKKEETPKKKILMKKLAIEYFDVVPFMKQKQRKKEKERKRQKEGTKRKQKRETRRKKERKRRKESERETEKEKEKKREAKKG